MWILYVVSIGFGTISIYIISRVSSKLSKQFGPSPSPKYDFDSFNKMLNFSLTSVCSQGELSSFEHDLSINFFHLSSYCFSGAQCPDQRLPIRLAVVSWFIFLFITTLSYSTTLISHVSIPLRRPSINSLQEIPNASGVNILVQKWNIIDDSFMVRLKHWTFKIRCIGHIFIIFSCKECWIWNTKENRWYIEKKWWSALSNLSRLYEKNGTRPQLRLRSRQSVMLFFIQLIWSILKYFY